MPLVLSIHGKRATALNVYFSLESPLATSSDVFVTFAAATFAAGDVVISKDGGAVANTANLPTLVTAAQPFYALALTATEMTADNISIVVHDVAGALWRDCRINVDTVNQLDTAQGTQPAGAPAGNETPMQMLQYLMRRFYNKVNQTSTAQTVFKDDAATVLTTMVCSNDGTTQVKGQGT